MQQNLIWHDTSNILPIAFFNFKLQKRGGGRGEGGYMIHNMIPLWVIRSHFLSPSLDQSLDVSYKKASAFDFAGHWIVLHMTL